MYKMKDLWISMGDEVSIRNFVEGPLSYRKLSTAEAANLIRSTVEQGCELSAYFDFGAVPSKKKVRTFNQLLSAFHGLTGVELDPQIFKMKRDDDEPFPNFNCFSTVTDTQDMLVVEYYFSMDWKKDSERPIDAIFQVATSPMHFHLFSRTGADLETNKPNV